jgi:hypothetical protein
MLVKNISRLTGILLLGMATASVAQMNGDSRDGFERGYLEKYLRMCDDGRPVLAMADYGAWGVGFHQNLNRAKQKAMEGCVACGIVDIDCESEYIQELIAKAEGAPEVMVTDVDEAAFSACAETADSLERLRCYDELAVASGARPAN